MIHHRGNMIFWVTGDGLLFLCSWNPLVNSLTLRIKTRKHAEKITVQKQKMTYQPVIVQPESNCAFSHCLIYIQFETWGHMYICSAWIQSLCKLQAYFIACILRQLLVFCLLRLLFMSQWWWNSRSRLDHQIMTTRRRPPCLYLPTLLWIYTHKWNKM